MICSSVNLDFLIASASCWGGFYSKLGRKQGLRSPRTTKAAQYLGFTFDETGPAIRESSLSRQWRKMRRAIKRARKSAMWRLREGKSGEAYLKKLYRRFSYITVNDGNSLRALRNFSSYGRRGAKAFGLDEKISQQVRRFERAAQREIVKLKIASKK